MASTPPKDCSNKHMDGNAATTDDLFSLKLCSDPSHTSQPACSRCLPTSELLPHTKLLLDTLSNVHDALYHHTNGMRYIQPALEGLAAEMRAYENLLSPGTKEKYETMVADWERTKAEADFLVAHMGGGR